MTCASHVGKIPARPQRDPNVRGENAHGGEKLFPDEGEREKSRIFLCHGGENASSELWDVQPALTGFIPGGHVKAGVWACPGGVATPQPL